MTRKSKRELERALADLDTGDDDASTEIVIRETAIKSGWSDEREDYCTGDAEPGDVIDTRVERIEL